MTNPLLGSLASSLATSYWIAQLVGPVLLIVTFGMAVNRRAYVTMARDFLDSPALIYLAGILMLIAGLAITVSHNIWVMDWPVVVTVFGWMAIIGGIFRMAIPNLVSSVGKSMIEKHSNLVPLTTAIVGLLGGVLTWYGYMT